MTGVHYRALPTLEIDGKQAPPNLMEDILQVLVEESLHLPGMFTLVIQNDYFPVATRMNVGAIKTYYKLVNPSKLALPPAQQNLEITMKTRKITS
jgi:hypothetical protein